MRGPTLARARGRPRRAPQAQGTGTVLFLVALFLAALALRPQLVGVGPLVPAIQDALGVPHAVVGLLGTIPVLCMGVFAVPAPYVLRRVGSRVAVGGCLAAIAVFGLLRAAAPGAAAVVALTLPIGIGMGLANALMPVAVKERFAARGAFATGIYVTGINLGAALAAAAAVPLANLAGGWRASLAVFSAVTVGVAAGWLVLTRREPAHVRPDARPVSLPLRDPLAWRLVAVFSLMSSVFYGLNAWLPDVYVEHGWSEDRAGQLLAVLNATALPVGFVVPWLADQRGSRRLYLGGGASTLVVAMLGLAVFPGGAWLWAALVGCSFGVLFPLVMTLPLDVSERPAQVGALAGMMLGAGYSFAACAPFVLGAVRDATGDFTATLWLLAGAAVGLLALCLSLSRSRLRRRVSSELPAVP